MTITNITDREIALQARVKELEEALLKAEGRLETMASLSLRVDEKNTALLQQLTEAQAQIEASRKQERVGIVKQKRHENGTFVLWNKYPTAEMELFAAPVIAPDVLEKYDELIYAVHSKFPNETRHETALRYIKRMEEPATTSTAKAMGGAND